MVVRNVQLSGRHKLCSCKAKPPRQTVGQLRRDGWRQAAGCSTIDPPQQSAGVAADGEQALCAAMSSTSEELPMQQPQRGGGAIGQPGG